MIEREKGNGLMDMMQFGIKSISEIIAASAFPPIVRGAESVMNTIEHRIVRIERRIARKITSLLVIGFGGILLLCGILFFLIEYLKLNNTSAFFTIGITVFVIGLILKLSESD